MSRFTAVNWGCMMLCFSMVSGPSNTRAASLHNSDELLGQGRYHDVKGDIERYVVSEGIATHDAGNLELVIDDVGGAEGWRFTNIWPDSLNIDHLYWNWLAIGYSSSNVSDGPDGDWSTTAGGNIVITEPGVIAAEEGYAQFNDTATQNGIQVTQYSYAWADPPDDDYVIIRYIVKNIGSLPIYTLYISHRSDFDVLGDHGYMPTDMSAFDTTRNLGYMWDTSSNWHVGVNLLHGIFRGYHLGWYSSTDAEKFLAMSTAGVDSATVYPDDYCFWLSTGPYFVTAGDSIMVAFAFLAGEDLADLQANADSAQAKWNSLGASENIEHDRQRKFHVNLFPNPFSTELNIECYADKGNVIVRIYDVAGRLVKSYDLEDCNDSSPSELTWDGTDNFRRRLPNGVYICRFQSANSWITQRVVLAR